MTISDYVDAAVDDVITATFVESTSGSLKIGEIVLVHENDPLPSDLILLDSHLKDGIAYIETGTLDGEKNLKPKLSPKETASLL